MIATDKDNEALRVMNICNACRYCEGLCATFQAMARQRTFVQGDLDYLANLCHNCTACFHDCQYAAPHELDVNVPKVFQDLRVETYERYSWPGTLGRLFHSNGLITMLVTTSSITILVGLALLLIGSETLFGKHIGPGSFYKIIGHGLMVAVAGTTFCFAILALGISVRRYWKSIGGGRVTAFTFWRATTDASTMKYLDGGDGAGCMVDSDEPGNARRIFHQLTMWGFLLCFAATCVATFYDYGLGLVAPYPYLSLPVVLGTTGGVGLLIGPAGLLWQKKKAHTEAMPEDRTGMDVAFLWSLFLVSLTGLILLAFREHSAMGLLLVIHLGFVLGFFLLIPYSKFVHGIYRFASLVKFAADEAN